MKKPDKNIHTNTNLLLLAVRLWLGTHAHTNTHLYRSVFCLLRKNGRNNFPLLLIDENQAFSFSILQFLFICSLPIRN